MNKFITLFTLLALPTTQALAGVTVVYGEDNRKDVYQVSNALHKKLAKSTAGMIDKRHFKQQNLFDYSLVNTVTLEEGMNVCSSEAFSQQPLGPNCSGFLVGPDTIVTAGHCYIGYDTPQNVCKNYAWVFDYHLSSKTHDPTRLVSSDNIYNCKEVLSAQLNNSFDFAIIRLDRKVTDRAPLKFRNSGTISNSASLVVIGHPTGLPTKIADGGKVTRNSEFTRFSTNLDTFQGNSGSAVFDAKTGLLEGILIMGKTDYRLSDPRNPYSCKVVNKCKDNGVDCEVGPEFAPVDRGEVVLRITALQDALEKALKSK